ncbi:MAG: class C beta-lactamase-related serine hydrolase [Bacteroidia bacterium]|nr:MAG: class C beta-lactamase-related serine hydrolase [Bacteroidia bacterium]
MGNQGKKSGYLQGNAGFRHLIHNRMVRIFIQIRRIHWTIPRLLFLVLVAAGCSKEPGSLPFEPFVWEISTPMAEGMDPIMLDSAFIMASDHGFVDGLMVVRNGKIVAEEYYNAYSVDRPHNIMSVSKSMLSAITGQVLYGEYGLDLEDKMLDYFPQYASTSLDPRTQDITIEHLLTMRMGIPGEAENDYAVYWELYSSDNWIKHTIEYPLVNDPGERMRYNTFITHLLSGVITQVTGQGTDEFAATHLFAPMGIDVDSWEKDPQGICFGGNSMHMTPREMAVFGLLYLQDGVLRGERILPLAWVEQSLSPSTNNTHPNEWGSWKNYNYARLWWLGQFAGYDSFMGYGYGGQFVIVFPDLDLIVVSMAPNNVNPDTSTIQEWAIFDLVTRYILPSIS